MFPAPDAAQSKDTRDRQASSTVRLVDLVFFAVYRIVAIRCFSFLQSETDVNKFGYQRFLQVHWTINQMGIAELLFDSRLKFFG